MKMQPLLTAPQDWGGDEEDAEWVTPPPRFGTLWNEIMADLVYREQGYWYVGVEKNRVIRSWRWRILEYHLGLLKGYISIPPSHPQTPSNNSSENSLATELNFSNLAQEQEVPEDLASMSKNLVMRESLSSAFPRSENRPSCPRSRRRNPSSRITPSLP